MMPEWQPFLSLALGAMSNDGFWSETAVASAVMSAGLLAFTMLVLHLGLLCAML